jgi:ubiquitin carboxyl-terminal hydrolase 34
MDRVERIVKPNAEKYAL